MEPAVVKWCIDLEGEKLLRRIECVNQAIFTYTGEPA
jgi:hypothetical protein